VKGEIPSNKIYEDDKTLAFLDIGPVSKGHALVISKEHAVRFHELSDESAKALAISIKKVSRAIEKAFHCDFNILNNNGSKSGQTVEHVHMHIIPRRGEKDEFHFEWPVKKYAQGEDKEILGKVKANL
jgi:histidine triad (HIT) family protein